MILHPRHFVRFLDGRAGDQAVIAFLPGALGVHLKTLQTDVRLGLEYARKLLRHRIHYETFAEIQATIDNGYCMLESERELCFVYVKDHVRPEIFYLLVKTNARRDELWLVTFYRIRKAQYGRKMRPKAILRDHSEPEFMG